MGNDLKKMAMDAFGYSEEQFNRLNEKQRKIIEAAPLRRQYKMIAEVVESANCGYKPKIGDKYVMMANGRLIPEECTFPICLWALAPFLPISYVVFDRISQGLDPNGHLFDHIRCTDTGCDCGGIGQVAFKIYCQKA